MRRWPSQMFLLLSVVAALAFYRMVSANLHNKTTLTIGYLTAVKGDLKDRQGLAVSGALTLALDEVNN